MVKTDHDVRAVHYAPPAAISASVEVTSLRAMRDRTGISEFLAPQRPDFDLVLMIESGETEHTVDFVTHRVSPGSVLWVRAGQLHQWGRIDAIEGPVVLFTPEAVPPRIIDRERALSPAAGVIDAFEYLASCQEAARGDASHGETLMRSALATLLLRLAIATPPTSSHHPDSEAFRWFRDEVEARFHLDHQVSAYAARIGYSVSTLNRLARRHTGRTAKQFVDDRVVLEAKRLLAHAELSVAAVGRSVGFADASNFNAFFRHRTGTTPGMFRVLATGWARPRPEPALRGQPSMSRTSGTTCVP